eukprot:scaffold24792_cov220-Isochrysis_galbana.AAC.1
MTHNVLARACTYDKRATRARSSRLLVHGTRGARQPTNYKTRRKRAAPRVHGWRAASSTQDTPCPVPMPLVGPLALLACPLADTLAAQIAPHAPQSTDADG